MFNYFLRRLVRASITLIGISIIIFVAIRMSGDPVMSLAPEDATEADIAEIRAELGLDKPVWVQYVIYAKNAVQGDFGRSIRYQQPALDMVAARLPATIHVGLSAFILATLIGVFLGVTTARYRGSGADYSIRMGAILCQSAPGLWLGMILILIFSVNLHWLPASGRGSAAHMVLPVVTLGLAAVASTMRLTRSSMLETLGSEYVRFLRSKGLSEDMIVWKHALRNSFIPVLAVMGLQLGNLMAGAIIVETVFNWPGVGKLMVEALQARDFPIIQAGAFLLSIMMVSINLLVDLLFGIVDPRIRYE